MKRNLFLYAMFMLLSLSLKATNDSIRIAFISDPHIQDVIGHPELLRTMDAQVQSTRLFNENIFAFRAALDDVVQRGIKLVVLGGDITDDGQIMNQTAAALILQEYEEKYGLSFFMTPGNHDPASPNGKHLPRKVYLNSDGSTRTVVSDSSGYRPGDEVVPSLFSVGHAEQMDCYRRYGYFPRKDYKYWSAPFCDVPYGQYTFASALSVSDKERRQFEYASGCRAYDASYVVEPVEGLWLISIDSGVYLPDGNTGKYKNSGVGYNNTLLHKPYLVPWVKKVYDDALRLGKQVIAFSHFPVLDFNNGASEILARSWGQDKFDIERVPTNEVSLAMHKAGVRLHFGGHMHVNNRSSMTIDGETMLNVQIPSLATCIPAYHVLTINCNDNRYDIATIVIDEVPGFDTFFETYRKEYEYTKSHGKSPIWSIEALQSKTYGEFCDWQFRDLVRIRFAVRDLPKVLREEMLPKSGYELMRRIGKNRKTDKAFMTWNGLDLLVDFYRFHYSGNLALRYITQERLSQYKQLFDAIERSKEDSEFMRQMRDFAAAFCLFADYFASNEV